jgi:hypothetical protein
MTERTLEQLANALACTDGINEWDDITDADFGLSFDYIVEDHGSIVVLDPTSRAALQWFYKHLPADCPRWGKLGYCVERNYVSDILEGLKRDGLYSEAEYVEAMNNEQELQNAQAHDADQNEFGYDYPEVY